MGGSKKLYHKIKQQVLFIHLIMYDLVSITLIDLDRFSLPYYDILKFCIFPGQNKYIINAFIHIFPYYPICFVHAEEVNLTDTLGSIRAGLVPVAAHYNLLLAGKGAHSVDTVKA